MARFSSSGPQVYCSASPQPSWDILPSTSTSTIPPTDFLQPQQGPPCPSSSHSLLSGKCPCHLPIPLFALRSGGVLHSMLILFPHPRGGPLPSCIRQHHPCQPFHWVHPTPATPKSRRISPNPTLEPHLSSLSAASQHLPLGGMWWTWTWIPFRSPLSWMALVVRQIQPDSGSSFSLSGHVYICLSNLSFLTLGLITSRIVHPGRTCRLHSQQSSVQNP